MDKKQCSKCGEIKNVSSFSKRKDSKDGYRGVCKSCNSTPEKLKQQREWIKADRKANPEKYKQKDKAKYDKRRTQILEQKKIYYIDNKESIRLRKQSYYNLNKDTILEKNRVYQKNNRESINRNKREYESHRRKNDPLFKLVRFQRDSLKRIIKAIKYDKGCHSIEYLGCSVEFLKNYIESQWEGGMNWSNHGLYGWHIDHIIPISTAKTKEDIIKLCHYTNLRPLWAEENLSKGSKILFAE